MTKRDTNRYNRLPKLLKVESDAPIPTPVIRRPWGRLASTLRNMPVGSRVFIPGYLPAQIGGYYKMLRPQRYTARRGIAGRKKNGCYVWRTL